MEENSKNIHPDEPQEVSKEYKEAMEKFKVTLKLSRIGEHFLNYIIQCRKIKVSPKNAISALKDMKKEQKETTDKVAIIPVLSFFNWFENPSEENFQELQSSLGVKIDKIVEDELNAKKQEVSGDK